MRYRYLAAVVFVAVFVRSVNLDHVPRWDWDEGVNLDITLNLVEGKSQMFALKYPFFPHPPLFFILASAFIKLFGASLLSLRIYAVSLSIATTILIYLISSRLFGEKKAFISGMLYAVYPVAVYWNRMGMVNNLIVFLSVSSLYLFIRFLKDKEKTSLYLSALLAGLCATTGVIGASTILAVNYLALKYCRKQLPIILILSLTPPALYLAYELTVMPAYFIFDVLFLVKRANFTYVRSLIAFAGVVVLYLIRGYLKVIVKSMRDTITEAPTLGIVVMSLYGLFVLPISDDGYHLGFADYLTYVLCVGLLVKPIFFIKDEVKKKPVLAYFTSYFLFLFAVDRADHMAMVLYPYLPILAAPFFAQVYEDAKNVLKRKNIPLYLIAATFLVYHPLLVSLAHSTGIAYALTVVDVEPLEIMLVSDYVNSITGEDSVVIGYSWMTHLIDSDFCIVGQSAAYDGHDVFYYPGNYPQGRFVFNCSYRNAHAIIMIDGTIDAMSKHEGFTELLAGVTTWDKHYIGVFGVYQNPNKTFLNR